MWSVTERSNANGIMGTTPESVPKRHSFWYGRSMKRESHPMYDKFFARRNGASRKNPEDSLVTPVLAAVGIGALVFVGAVAIGLYQPRFI